ncbi:hypothetical protein TraAM80_02117 [Trypanosoma rangeli]|uniref:Proteasome inhibitor PI31 subunit n=1 Tax=Trypanosoma rangeli TaxID=5698 RepID=A0A3R7MXB2_TRYRA|nr:uncharacterized protein TraAM80_02117 [Trypanosoma rangeli]RNF09508.1 hypothetical protein TraAM80_02117 [Trypanosoma rangeli]|eukprot:RNF09508.1 hypothetical protein TraAM80_02117 [Trypanosoma rangeli]
MELATALTAAMTPIVRAIFLMMSAIHDGDVGDKKTWKCCHTNGATAESPSVTEAWLALQREGQGTPPVVEMHYRLGDTGDNIVRVKWVPTDNTHLVLILQHQNDTAVSREPVTISLCTECEPLKSSLLETTQWTAEAANAAVARLRPALFDHITRQQYRPYDSNSNNNSGDGNGAMSLRAEPPRQAVESRQEYIPAAPYVTEPQGVTQPMFAGTAPRPPGFRYGEGDLVPGGSLSPEGGSGGGMMLGPRAFHGGGVMPVRYDPMFPGDLPDGSGMRGRGRGRVFPGEPDPDNLAPPGGPAFQMGFGPGGARGFGGAGGGFIPPF